MSKEGISQRNNKTTKITLQEMKKGTAQIGEAVHRTTTAWIVHTA